MQIKDIEGIGRVYNKKLKAIGINTTDQLLLGGAFPKGRRKLAKQIGIKSRLFLEWINRADLMRINGVGEEYSDMLESVGVDTVVELSRRRPENLYLKIMKKDLKRVVRRKPTFKEVDGWIKEAKKMDRIVCYSNRQKQKIVIRTKSELDELIKSKRLDLLESELINYVLYRFDPDLDIFHFKSEIPKEITNIPNGAIFRIKGIYTKHARVEWHCKVWNEDSKSFEFYAKSFKVPLTYISSFGGYDWVVKTENKKTGETEFSKFNFKDLIQLLKARTYSQVLYPDTITEIYNLIKNEIKSTWANEIVNIARVTSDGNKSVANRYRPIDFSKVPEGTAFQYKGKKSQGYSFYLNGIGQVSFGNRIVFGKVTLPEELVDKGGLNLNVPAPEFNILSRVLKVKKLPKSAIGMKMNKFIEKYIDVEKHKNLMKENLKRYETKWKSMYREKKGNKLITPKKHYLEFCNQIPRDQKVSIAEMYPGCPVFISVKDKNGIPIDIAAKGIVPAGNSIDISQFVTLSSSQTIISQDETLLDTQDMFLDEGCCDPCPPSDPFDSGWNFSPEPSESAWMHYGCKLTHFIYQINENWSVHIQIKPGPSIRFDVQLRF